ncbi:MAG: hypothetical protein C0423_10435 [Methylibium sp.]|nr:hypothetical protein [Methylibium sp.]
MTQGAATSHSSRQRLWSLAPHIFRAAGLLLLSSPLIVAAQDNLPAAAPTKPALAVPATLISPDWHTLSADQQRLLKPLAAEWNTLESASRVRWIELTARHNSMPVEEQRLLEERIASWALLSPAERQQARQSFQQVRQTKPQDLQAKWEAYQALPPEQREALAGKAAQKRQPTAVNAAGTATASVAGAASAADRKPAAGLSLSPMPAPIKTARQVPGSALLQAKPGATTVLITQRPAPVASKVRRKFFDPKQLDDKTLLPRTAATPAGEQS